MSLRPNDISQAADRIRETATKAQEVWLTDRWTSTRPDRPYTSGMRTSDLDRHAVVTADEHGSILLTSGWDEAQIIEHAASWDPQVAQHVAGLLEAINNSVVDSSVSLAAMRLASSYLREGS